MSTEAKPTTEKTPTEILAELEQQIAEKTLALKGDEPETTKKIEEAKADLEYLALQERFNALGKQDQKYAIVDVTSHGKGFVVLVTGPRAEVHRKAFAHLVRKDELTDAKILEITREYVRHPEVEAFDAMASELPAVVDVCFLAIQELWGARARIRQAK